MKRHLVFLGASLVLVAVVLGVAAGAVQEPGNNVYRLMGIFGRVLSLVRTSYVEDVPMDTLELGAMNGLVKAADPGGEWVPADSAPAVRELRDRRLPAFGLGVGMRSDYPFVLSVVPGSAAEQAGLRAGELIERIGETPVRARPLWVAQLVLDRAEHLDGRATLEVIDARLQGKREVSLVEALVTIPPASVRRFDDVPVVRIPVLADGAVESLRGQLNTIGSAAAIVVDLRGVSLGSNESAVSMAAELAGGEVVLQSQRREGPGARLTSRGPERAWRVIVALDATTGHAAEVLALALKSRGATLVGTGTYGDTAFREPFRGRGGFAWMASEWFESSDGKPILGHGLVPDEEVRYRPGVDAILDRAVELAHAAVVDKAA